MKSTREKLKFLLKRDDTQHNYLLPDGFAGLHCGQKLSPSRWAHLFTLDVKLHFDSWDKTWKLKQNKTTFFFNWLRGNNVLQSPQALSHESYCAKGTDSIFPKPVSCKHQYKARRVGMVLSGTWEGLPLRGKKHRNPEEIWQQPVIWRLLVWE